MTNGIKGPWTAEEEYFRDQLTMMSKLPENSECADCTSKAPRWAVFNHGVFVCIKCSGQHRNLGTGISKVRSINLDRWKPEQFEQMVGNTKANAELLYNMPSSLNKPNEDDDYARLKWIQAKYVQRKYARKDDQAPIDTEEVQQEQPKHSHHSHSSEKREVTPMQVKPVPIPMNSITPPVIGSQVQHAPKEVKVAPPPPVDDLLDIFNPAPVQQVVQPPKPVVQQIQQQPIVAQQPKPAVKTPAQNPNDLFGDIMQMYDKPVEQPLQNANAVAPKPKVGGFDINQFIGGQQSQQNAAPGGSYKPQGFQW